MFSISRAPSSILLLPVVRIPIIDHDTISKEPYAPRRIACKCQAKSSKASTSLSRCSGSYTSCLGNEIHQQAIQESHDFSAEKVNAHVQHSMCKVKAIFGHLQQLCNYKNRVRRQYNDADPSTNVQMSESLHVTRPATKHATNARCT
eukprot:6209565-Pleurochrysis_carterae.AAC.3